MLAIFKQVCDPLVQNARMETDFPTPPSVGFHVNPGIEPG